MFSTITIQGRSPEKECFLFYFFIGPESDHWLCLSVTDLLTHCTDSLTFGKLDSCDPEGKIELLSQCNAMDHVRLRGNLLRMVPSVLV